MNARATIALIMGVVALVAVLWFVNQEWDDEGDVPVVDTPNTCLPISDPGESRPPDMEQVEDTNGDGRADKRTTVTFHPQPGNPPVPPFNVCGTYTDEDTDFDGDIDRTTLTGDLDGNGEIETWFEFEEFDRGGGTGFDVQRRSDRHGGPDPDTETVWTDWNSDGFPDEMVEEEDIDKDGEPDWITTWTDLDFDGTYDRMVGKPILNGEPGPEEEEVVETPAEWQTDLDDRPPLN